MLTSTRPPGGTGGTGDVLASIVDRVDGCTDASVIVVRRGRTWIAAATRHAARAADAAQISADSGPALTALRSAAAITLAPIVRGPGRFEEFKAAATEVGFATCVAIPFPIDDQTRGAITFYGTGTTALDTGSVDEFVLAALATAL